MLGSNWGLLACAYCDRISYWTLTSQFQLLLPDTMLTSVLMKLSSIILAHLLWVASVDIFVLTTCRLGWWAADCHHSPIAVNSLLFLSLQLLPNSVSTGIQTSMKSDHEIFFIFIIFNEDIDNHSAKNNFHLLITWHRIQLSLTGTICEYIFVCAGIFTL